MLSQIPLLRKERVSQNFLTSVIFSIAYLFSVYYNYYSSKSRFESEHWDEILQGRRKGLRESKIKTHKGNFRKVICIYQNVRIVITAETHQKVFALYGQALTVYLCDVSGSGPR